MWFDQSLKWSLLIASQRPALFLSRDIISAQAWEKLSPGGNIQIIQVAGALLRWS